LVDTIELRKNIPSYQKRKNARQPETKYGLFIYKKITTELTKKTKKKKAIVSTEHKKENSKSYKNITWLNRMYERKMKENPIDPLYKVVIPLQIPNGYKLYDHKGQYYATVLDQNDVFYFLAIQKDTEDIHFFLRTFVDKMFIQAQCGGPYGFIVPEEFYKNYERID